MKEWKNPLTYLFAKTWKYSPSKKKVVTFWGLFIVNEGIETFLSPLIVANIVNIVQTQGVNSQNLNHLFLLLGLLVLLTIIDWTMHGPARVMEMGNAFLVRANDRRHLLKGILNLPLSWHVDNHSGDTIDKVSKGTGALHDFSETSFQTIYAGVRLLGSYCMIVYVSHLAAIIVLIMMLISIVITMKFDAVLEKHYQALNRAENKVSEGFLDAITNITTIVTLRVEELILKLRSKEIDEPYNLQVRSNKVNELKWFLVQLSCTVMTALVLGTYFWMISKEGKTILIGSIFLLIRYLDRICDLFFQFAGQYSDILKHKSKVTNSESIAKSFKDSDSEKCALPKDWKMLSVRNLAFAYAGGKDGDSHLRNLSFDIRRGQKIAFVGTRGSGKSTTLKVLRNLYQPQKIDLVVDGIPIPQGLAGVGEAIALIPQSPEIFTTTIRDNITFGAEVSEEKLRHFTDMACFTEVWQGLPKGLDSTTREKGVNLSGGEQQGLALARGLLASEDREILLLDEPTSSLDKNTEREVYRNILGTYPEKTIISTVHGLHLLPLFDTIYVFDKGEIVGTGTVEELLVSCPMFQKLWRAMEHSGEDES